VAAAPAEGESEPSVFETRHDLHVTDWQLHSILVVDAQADRYENLSHLADPATVSDGRFPFQAGQSIAHEFYVAHAPILSQANIAELRIDVDIHRDFSLPPGNRLITWFAMSSDGEIELIPHNRHHRTVAHQRRYCISKSPAIVAKRARRQPGTLAGVSVAKCATGTRP
jgi:hypothetical protein